MTSRELSRLNSYNDRLTLTEHIRQTFSNQEEKLNEYKKIDAMAFYIRDGEAEYYRTQHIFDYELAKMWENHRNLVRYQGMPTTLSNLIEKSLQTITDQYRDTYYYKVDYYLRNAYDTFERVNINENQSILTRNQFSLNLIVNTKHSLTEKQLQLLNRGPTYVPTCQMYLSPSYSSLDDILKQQFAPLKRQLASLFSKYRINLSLSMEIQRKLFDRFKTLFSISIPVNLQQRAFYEKKLIQSIRLSLQEDNLILRRTADNMNTFYLGNRQEFEEKANKFMARSEAYESVLCLNDDTNKEQQISKYMNQMVTSMNTLLEKLREQKSLDNKTIDSFIVDCSKLKLPYLYFLPDVSKVRLPKISYSILSLFLLSCF